MPQFRIQLRSTYYHQGFFNVGVSYAQYLSSVHGAEITIQLGNADHAIQGYINRTANTNGTPRIMCGIAYTRWVQDHFNLHDQMTIEILSSQCIKIIFPTK